MSDKFLNESGLAQFRTWILNKLGAKQDTLTFDSSPTAGSSNPVTSDGIKTVTDDLQFQLDGLGEPFRLQDFSQSIGITIPSVMNDIANTSIPNIDIDLDVIDSSGKLNKDFAIAGLVKYEVTDSSGNRLNVFPVCTFSMNTQRTLRVRMMCAGNTGKWAVKIQGALLLKHR